MTDREKRDDPDSHRGLHRFSGSPAPGVREGSRAPMQCKAPTRGGIAPRPIPYTC